MMKFYDYNAKNEDGTYGRMLTEEEVANLANAMDCNKMYIVKFVVSKMDVENGVVYGSTTRTTNY